MEKKKNNVGLIVLVIVVVLLFIPIIVDYVKKQNITEISLSDLNEKIKTSNTFVIYKGTVDKETKKSLRKIRNSINSELTDYSYEYDIYNIEDSDEVDKLLGKDTNYAIYIEGEEQKSYSKEDLDELKEDMETYIVSDLNEENRSYKVAKDFKTYKNIVKSDDVTMAVFGRDTCYYCNMFKPIYNAVANKYNLDIYFFDSDSYDKTEYNKIINLDLTIPGKCNSNTQTDFKLSDGFGTPLTIFTQNNKVIDCISGYVNRATLIQKLKSLNMISE